MKPITRYERYLAYLGSDEDANGIDSPVTRIEQYLSKIAGENVPIPEKPILRIEQYLAKIAGEDVAIPEKPILRVEMYLAAIAGEDVEVPEPITREEWYLAQWAENGSGVLKTVSGAVVHITDALAKAVEKLEVSIEPAQDLHGQDSPWPAGGGKNLVPQIGGNNTYIGVTVSYDSTTETYTLNGTANAAGNIDLAGIPKDNLKWIEDSTYTISCRVVGGSFTIPSGSGNTYALSIFNTGYSKFIRGAVNLSESGLDGYSATGSAFTSSAYFTIMFQTFRSGITFNNLKLKVQIESGSTATAWSPYENICPITGYTGCNVWDKEEYNASVEPTISVSFPAAAGTVYDGSLDVVSGKLFAKYGYADMGDLIWYADANRPSVFWTNSLSNVIKKVSPWADVVCSEYKLNKDGPDAISNGQISTTNAYGAGAIFLKNDAFYGYESSAVQSALRGVQLVYELAEPIEYTITQQEIIPILGENYIWADTGDVEVTYYADGNEDALGSLNMLLGGMYTNNHTEEDVPDREALRIILGETT